MAEHVWSVLCYKGVVDKDTNQVSLLDVVESLTAEVDPATAAQIREAENPLLQFSLQLVTLWTRSDYEEPEETVTFRVRFLPPDGRQRFPPTEDTFNLAKSVRSRTRVVFPGLPYYGDGAYVLEVAVQAGRSWRRVARVPLDIRLRVRGEDLPSDQGKTATHS